MDISRAVIVTVLVVALLAIAAAWAGGEGGWSSEIRVQREDVRDADLPPPLQSFRSETYGISFEYPAGYRLDEREGAEDGGPVYVVTLLSEEAVRSMSSRSGEPAGEGPTVITFEVFSYGSTDRSLATWLAENPRSNLALGSGSTTDVIFGGNLGVRYEWDGLYRGESVAFIHGHWVAIVSVTSIASIDAIRTDFGTILGTITFSPERAPAGAS
jgi:hypothetical protein